MTTISTTRKKRHFAEILGNGVTVARLALNQLVQVQILVPQLACLGLRLLSLKEPILSRKYHSANDMCSNKTPLAVANV